jgi:uncharacterized membrane protein YfcA
MILILEILLTVAAWRRGWRAKALIPLGTCLGVGIFVGMAIGASGGSPERALPVLALGDVACVIVLSVMSSRAPRSRPRADEPDKVSARQSVASGMAAIRER